jgi:Tfp pilus assembly protein PilV
MKKLVGSTIIETIIALLIIIITMSCCTLLIVNLFNSDNLVFVSNAAILSNKEINNVLINKIMINREFESSNYKIKTSITPFDNMNNYKISILVIDQNSGRSITYNRILFLKK